MKKIAIACGGTGGHINPAIAVAEALRAQRHELTLIVSGQREADRRAVANWSGVSLCSGAMPMRHVVRNLIAILRCRAFLKKTRPELLFTTGGYTSFAPVVAARWLGIPVVMHEANSVAGEAVVFLSRYLKIEAVALSFAETAAQLPWVKTELTGLPLRASVLAELEKARALPKEEETFTIFVTGGSQGAHGMNLLVAPILASFARAQPTVRIVHQCGVADMEAMREIYKEVLPHVELCAFIDSIGFFYGRAEVVIARAGAATCFELAQCAVPTLFIPLPTAKDDHQTKNAEALVRQGGAIVFHQRTVRPEQIAEVLGLLYADPTLLTAMHEALAALPLSDATAKVAALLVRTEASL
ncbi:MAG: UDP-N-acetylglucosamine--N-acetylmuramyl-(pentapeptide) pyrophosphoryl-undecaprenol N-acetylglucosamine transferase [Kiritimatiellia bacterium]